MENFIEKIYKWYINKETHTHTHTHTHTMSTTTIRDFYSTPQAGGLAVFAGSRRQIGGSFLSGLSRYALPVLKFLGKKVAKVAGNVISDVIDNKPVGESIKKHGLQELKNTLQGKGRRKAAAAAGQKRKCTSGSNSRSNSSCQKRRRPPPPPPPINKKPQYTVSTGKNKHRTYAPDILQ